jgi:beta-lactamase class A
MTPSPTGKKRLKVGLPKNWSIAHKTGMGLDVLGVNTATKDVGVINSPSGQQFAIAPAATVKLNLVLVYRTRSSTVLRTQPSS